MNPGRFSLLIAVLTCWLSNGCAIQAPSEQDESAPAVAIAPTTLIEKPKLPVRAFSRETLYSLLTAELAGSRQQYEIALNNYAQQAKETRDPQVAERATLIARYLNDTQAASDNALLWVELAPNNDEALANAAVALMQAGRALEAFEMSRRLQQKGKETLFQSIAANSSGLTPADREALLEAYLAQLHITPKDEQLLVGAGLLSQMQGKTEEAQQYARRALESNPNSIPAALLETNLLHQLNRTQEAIVKMAALLELYPDNQRLRLQYARILAHHDLTQAQQQFEILVAQIPGDGDLLLSLGLVALERKDYPAATKALEQLLDNDQHLSTAHFYLGQIAELDANPKQALLHYLQVEPGNEFLQATVNLFNILVAQGDLPSARDHIARLSTANPTQADGLELLYAQALIRHNQWPSAEKSLTRALTKSPKNTQLLYARAMLKEKQNQPAAAERDLRAIINLEPNNATALNTLGYLLVDRNERLDEAHDLLLKAISLKPDDPAIIDSVGWLHFRTGNYPEALIYLRRAFATYPDAEIAAHLGEVLWVIEEFEEAQEIWKQGLELSPDNDIIKSTIERLQAPLP